MAVDSGLILYGRTSDDIHFSTQPKELQQTIDKITIKLEQAKRELSLSSGIEISLVQPPLPHIGLGSGTALTLASIEALLVLNNYEYDHHTIQRLSERGGTSGVGIHSYFTGGVVFDSGVPPESRPHKPSGCIKPVSIPSLLFRKDYPFEEIKFLYPEGKLDNFGKLEEDFFRRHTPISKTASFEACYNSIFMVAASLADKNFDCFARAIDEIRSTTWKLSEIKNCGSDIQDVFKSLERAGVIGAGMSSMGPGIFIVSSTKEAEVEKIKQAYNLNEITLTPNNTGRWLKYV